MTQHTFSIHWSVDQGPSIIDAAGELTQTCYGLPGLRSGQSNYSRFLKFTECRLLRAEVDLDTIKTWLKRNGARDITVMVDDSPIDAFLHEQLLIACANLEDAVARLKSIRRVWPNKEAQTERRRIEAEWQRLQDFVA